MKLLKYIYLYIILMLSSCNKNLDDSNDDSYINTDEDNNTDEKDTNQEVTLTGKNTNESDKEKIYISDKNKNGITIKSSLSLKDYAKLELTITKKDEEPLKEDICLRKDKTKFFSGLIENINVDEVTYYKSENCTNYFNNDVILTVKNKENFDDYIQYYTDMIDISTIEEDKISILSIISTIYKDLSGNISSNSSDITLAYYNLDFSFIKENGNIENKKSVCFSNLSSSSKNTSFKGHIKSINVDKITYYKNSDCTGDSHVL